MPDGFVCSDCMNTYCLCEEDMKPEHYQFDPAISEVKDITRQLNPHYVDKWGATGLCEYTDIVEYILRAPRKNGKEDLEKAYYLLGWLLQEIDNAD